MKSDKEVLISNKIHDYIDNQKHNPEQSRADAAVIRAYCKETNCGACLLKKHGLQACHTMGALDHPLDDPVYVARCMEVLREVIDDGDATNMGDVQ